MCSIEMTQEIRELKKQLKATPAPIPAGGSESMVIEELRQNLEKETIERLLREDDLTKMTKEFETFKKLTEEARSGNKEIKELTTRLRALEDEKVPFIIYDKNSFSYLGDAITKCRGGKY